MDMLEGWEKALDLLRKSFTFSEATLSSNIEKIIPIRLENNILTLKAYLDAFKDAINARYLPEITRCVRSAMQNSEIEVLIVSDEDFKKPDTSRISSDNYAKTNLRPKYIFETFVKGKCNEFAHAASLAIAESPGTTEYNPFFLYGGVGLGKTHLLHSIGNFIVEKNTTVNVMYVSTETFTNEFIASIREQRTRDFKNKYRNCDVLLLDDIQFLEGKVETQEEMFHTFNVLYDNNKQIVITSDQPVKELTSIEQRLRNRFSMGLTVDVTMPDYETRAAILEKKLAMEHLTLPQDVKEFITNNIVSNIRDLEGALNKVTAYARLMTNSPITLEIAERALKDQLVGNEQPEITVPYIQEVVASHYKLTLGALSSKKRTRDIVYPRQIALYLSRKLLEVSLLEVGEYFGGLHHSTVIHSCDKIVKDLETDANIRIVVNELERKITGELA